MYKHREIEGNHPQYEIKPYVPGELPSTQFKFEEYEPAENVHLRDYLSVILRRKWIVITFFISIVVTVTISSFLMKPVYRSTAVIKIDKETPNVLAFKDVQLEKPDEDYYTTQYKILKSRNVAKKTIQRLNLDKNPDFNPMAAESPGIFSSIKSSLGGILPFFRRGDDKLSETDEKAYGPLVDSFLSDLDITPVQKSQLVQISFMSPNPQLAMETANAVAQTYIDFNIDSRLDASQQARSFLEKQLGLIKAKVEASEEALNDYASKNEMFFVDQTQDKQNILTQKLTDVSSALNASMTNRFQTEAQYRQLSEGGTENSMILGNPLIQGLKKEYAALEAEYFNQLRIYKPEFPKMKRLRSQMDAIQRRINHEKKNLVKSAQSDYNAARMKEGYLSREFDSTKKQILDFQKKNIQYQILKRDVDANKEMYNSLLQRLNEVSVSATKTSTNIQVLDAAELPKAPYKPNKPRNILFSIVFGLIGGVGLAFFIEYFDNTIKNTQEVEKSMGLPTLGMIPHQKLAESIKRPLITHSQNRGPIAEAFRSIGTFIMLSSSSKPPKTILVTSPGEKEGKTTICINTAMALAESLGNGIIIDADLRKPKLHHSFEVENSIGLTTFLSGNVEFDPGLIKKTSVNGLSILTSGPLCPNPSELIVSKRMKDLIDALHTIYDFIIIDSAPIMGMPDSIYLSSIVDGSVVVIKAGETSKHALAEARRIYKSINAKILGVVLNGIKANDLKYNYYSNYYSSYFKEPDSF